MLTPWRATLSDGDLEAARASLEALSVPDMAGRIAWPWPETVGTNAFLSASAEVLKEAWPDFERRDFIAIAGTDDDGLEWVGCAGHYVGTFARPLFDIPPTGHFAHMRFHEFYRFKNGKLVEIQAIWDLPEVMMQAGAWPLSPSLGRDLFVPGPATQDGLDVRAADPGESERSKTLIIDMLDAMQRHPREGGPEVMQMDRFWHPSMTWYGPAGIGTARGIAGFRAWHQIPYLKAMPDRGTLSDDIRLHFFAEGPYAAVTGWPNMAQTLTGDGWLGIAPSDQKLLLRSLDFWRIEDGKIRENWVLVDLLNMYRQIGVDVLARMREFNKAKQGFDPETGRAIPGAFQ
ncbi:MAG: ester cyclase [Devosiaceae bacterium]|nr:ester cyclase [Devosiaceae bacterium MH13]